MKTKLIILSTILLFAFSSCNSNKKATHKHESIAVEAMTPMSKQQKEFISSGSIKANTMAQIGTRMMGYVNEVHVKKGQSVKKGQLLVSISDEELQAKKHQAEAMIKQAEEAYKIAQRDQERFARLLAQKSISQKEYENIHLQYKAMESKLQMAIQMRKEVEAHRKYTKIHAPFSGIITATFIKKGSLASPGHPLITLEKKGEKIIETQVNVKAIQLLQKGDTAIVFVKATQQRFQSIIIERSESSTTTGGRYNITLSIPEKYQSRLLSGMHVEITYTAPSLHTQISSIWLPQKAIVSQGGLKGVYSISSGGQALLHWVRLGKRKGKWVEILSGVDLKDKIIINSLHRIQNGTAVHLKK